MIDGIGAFLMARYELLVAFEANIFFFAVLAGL